jgi:hypothetical protein
MDIFYSIVLGIATLALIIMFIVMGVLISKNNATTTYPPYVNTCPNYWMSDASGNCYIPQPTGTAAAPTPAVNIGNFKPNADSQKPKMAGLNASHTYINFNDKAWATLGKSATCAKKTWAVGNQILCDGISNYNGSC